MKNNKKWFIVTEAALAVMVLVLVFCMMWEKNKESSHRVSVIVQDSDDSRWTAFRYGLKMAAMDHEIEIFVVSTVDMVTPEEEESLIKQEIAHGADAVIVQPVPGDEMEEKLNKIEKQIPIMLVEHAVSTEQDNLGFPVTEADNYEMGKVLAGELVNDYNGNVRGKTLGFISEAAGTEAVMKRKKGFEDFLKDMGAEIRWSFCGPGQKPDKDLLGKQPKVDFVIALDDGSLKMAGEYSAANNLHGALVYGIGNSTEAVYYLDTGAVECLVVPDEFSVGYQSLTETAKCLQNYFYMMEDHTVSHTVLRREELFSEKNQKILFTMSQ